MNWKLIWRGLKKPALRNKLLAVFGILVVSRILAHIPMPLGEAEDLHQLIENLLNEASAPQILQQYNLLSGGALASLSIMLIGLNPYITASIIMQVLAKVFPSLEKMQKEGEYGRRKINQYTRILTLPLAIIQSIGFIFIVRELSQALTGSNALTQSSITDWMMMVTALTTGALIMMWLGELITEKGIGNGISLLITVAIVSQIPYMANWLWDFLRQDPEIYRIWFLELNVNPKGLWVTLVLIASTLLITLFVVYLNEAHRRIKLSYAKKIQGNRVYSGVHTFLPLKLIAAGVIPIIFALTFLSVPQLLGQLLLGSEALELLSNPQTSEATIAALSGWEKVGYHLTTLFSPPNIYSSLTSWKTYIYPGTYMLLVAMFTYFYTGVVFSAKDISERLQRQGAFIEGVRPGLATQKYLSKIVNRLNLFGALSLGFLALTPIIFQLGFAQFNINAQNLALAGTSILILVAVALETLRQIESKALVATYEDYTDQFRESNSSKAKTNSKLSKLLRKNKSSKKNN